ncbi:hypothetical protein CH354_11245 [Leptospira levettii]|nr:hypothetical protein CH354_11245 [Leptospira levettii]
MFFYFKLNQVNHPLKSKLRKINLQIELFGLQSENLLLKTWITIVPNRKLCQILKRAELFQIFSFLEPYQYES